MYTKEEKLLKMSELVQKVASLDITGQEPAGHYAQVITCELTEEEKAFLEKFQAKKVPFKQGHKTRFYFPHDVILVEDRVPENPKE